MSLDTHESQTGSVGFGLGSRVHMAPSNDPHPGESLGARIKRLREDRDLTQVELAALIGVAVQTNGPSATSRTIIDWEADRTTPSPRMQRVLARTFQISVEYLMTGAGSSEPQAPATSREQLLDHETRLSDHAGRIAHLEAPDRRQGNRMRDEGKIATEVSELREALTLLANSHGELASQLLATGERLQLAEERIQALEDQQAGGSATGGE